jgi:hypothetical protein
MLKSTFSSFLVLMMIFAFSVNLHSQQCEVITKNIVFESDNSLTFDVYIHNTGTSSFTYSHGSFAWNYDTAILNGGTPTFSLVPGYSDFSAGAYPPSALITSPNILRTSSNMPGSNGAIQPDQSLLLYRFRLQTSASSFSSEYLDITWKNETTPYTRIYSWDDGTGLPIEIQNPEYSVQELLLVDDFDFTGLLTANGWTAHSGGGTQPIETTTGLTYTDYPGSGVGNAAGLDQNGEDDNRQFTTVTSGYVYYSALVNVTSAVQGYFLHLGNSNSAFHSRVYVQPSVNTGKINFGMSNSSSGAVYGTTDFDLGTTYLIIVKSQVANPGTNDVWVISSGVPATEIAAGTPEISTNVGTGLTSITGIYLRQYSATQNITVDGIRIGTNWEDLFPASGTPTITVSPTSLSGFTYFIGSGPSASQSYDLSGSDLDPAAGNIVVSVVTSPYSYEVSLDDVNFSNSVSKGYTGGTLSSTPIYVRLKAGLTGGEYNGELIANEGGGATTQNVTCNGAVVVGEPTNYPTNFTGVLGNPPYYYNNLTWTDATGSTLPDGYLIKSSYISFADISDPVDGVPELDGLRIKNVAQGVQSVVFTGFGGSTYYYKIFPYTGTASDINYKTDGSVPQFNITNDPCPILPVTENFDFTTGSNLTDNGWVAHGAPGTNPITVGATTLTYPDYLNSGLGKSAILTASGEDDNRAFDSAYTGSLYVSFMVNVQSATTTGDYFFHFGPENTTSVFCGKVFVKDDGSGNLAFGVSKRNNTGTAVYTLNSYSLNTTYLLVVKYTFNTGSTVDDEVSLWVNPVLNGIEPTADLTATDGIPDPTSLGMFALRQGGSSPALTIGGIRVSTSWVPESGITTFSFSVNVFNGWNMVSGPGLHPTNQNVGTWWTHLTGTVWGYNGAQYVAKTIVTPGVGYWMNNTIVETYNYSAIQIVPHDPVPVTFGWNMIGGYETSPTIIALKAANPQITGTVWGYNGSQYVAATNLVPGYGYWAYVTTAGTITIPDALAKGNGEVEELFKEDWGRIVLTDAAGISFTLYAVKGEVDLDQYNMPPLPPAGSFDIRYGSGRMAEDINSSVKTIDMIGITYPLTVRAEGMDMRLMDETGKTVNVNLKSGESVAINDATIQKLMVTSELMPTVYSLEQNYPNPFNPSTVIEFSLPEDVSNVKLSVYNALGEKVAELVNTALTAGKYSYQWNARNVATGMYIYELRTDKFVSVKKMLLLK